MLTEKEKATNYETMKHIERVRNLLNYVVEELLKRGEEHDQTKLESPEVEMFAEYTDRLADCTYGSKEYDELRKQLDPALKHHYAKNRHHAEHHENGIDDMNLIDIVELFCDWTAASERHNDGNILKSIQHNRSRYNLSDQLAKILTNTAKLVDNV